MNPPASGDSVPETEGRPSATPPSFDTNALAITRQLQALYSHRLLALLDEAGNLVRSLPKKRKRLAHLVFVSLAQRIFFLIRDIADIFSQKPETGYHASAILTRSLMETATTMLVLERDNYGPMLEAFVRSSQEEFGKQRDGLTAMVTSKNPTISKAASREVDLVSKNVEVMKRISERAGVSTATKGFPKMETRCKLLGEFWTFMYHATYRELSVAVHGGFAKIPHSSALASRAPDKGAAVLFEHCRAMNYAVEFWGTTVLEVCAQHPDQKALGRFREALDLLVHDADPPTRQLSGLVAAHTIEF